MINKKIIILLSVLLCWPLTVFAATKSITLCGVTSSLTCSVSGQTLSCSRPSNVGSCYYGPYSSTSANSQMGVAFATVSFTSGATGGVSGRHHVCATGSFLNPVRECWSFDINYDVALYYIGLDPDNDNRGSTSDNCPNNANWDQANNDGDSQGNVCDTDDDNDGVLDTSDNCPLNANANQLNTDGDAQGNVCDTDDDNDGVSDGSDKFPLDPTETIDTDNDGIGNNADLDDDGDGVPDYIDAAPLNAANASEVLLPLNNGYKGSSVGESVALPL